MILQFLGLLALTYLIRSLVAVVLNSRRASSIGIPLVRLPIGPQNIVWMIIKPHLWLVLDHLPVDKGTLFSSRMILL